MDVDPYRSTGRLTIVPGFNELANFRSNRRIQFPIMRHERPFIVYCAGACTCPSTAGPAEPTHSHLQGGVRNSRRAFRRNRLKRCNLGAAPDHEQVFPVAYRLTAPSRDLQYRNPELKAVVA